MALQVYFQYNAGDLYAPEFEMDVLPRVGDHIGFYVSTAAEVTWPTDPKIVPGLDWKVIAVHHVPTAEDWYWRLDVKPAYNRVTWWMYRQTLHNPFSWLRLQTHRLRVRLDSRYRYIHEGGEHMRERQILQGRDRAEVAERAFQDQYAKLKAAEQGAQEENGIKIAYMESYYGLLHELSEAMGFEITNDDNLNDHEATQAFSEIARLRDRARAIPVGEWVPDPKDNLWIDAWFTKIEKWQRLFLPNRRVFEGLYSHVRRIDDTPPETEGA